MVDDFKPVVTNVPSVPVDPPKRVEPVVKSARDQVRNVVSEGGDVECPCTVVEFNAIHDEFRSERRACKLDLKFVDGVLYASARL